MIKYTIEEYEALRKAYAEGVMEVKYADRSVKYTSTEEMRRILEEMNAQLFKSKPKRRKTLFTLGLHDC